jgi:hypothetical protein
MEPTQPDVLAERLLQLKPKRRKDLLPWWIRAFNKLFFASTSSASLAMTKRRET